MCCHLPLAHVALCLQVSALIHLHPQNTYMSMLCVTFVLVYLPAYAVMLHVCMQLNQCDCLIVLCVVMHGCLSLNSYNINYCLSVLFLGQV